MALAYDTKPSNDDHVEGAQNAHPPRSEQCSRYFAQNFTASISIEPNLTLSCLFLTLSIL